MNTETLNAVADLIEYTDRFDLSTFSSQKVEDDLFVSYATPEQVWDDCGTTACFAGWVNTWAGAETFDELANIHTARKELGLSEEFANELFYGQGELWDDVIEAGLIPSHHGSSETTAAEAAAILRAIADGKIETTRVSYADQLNNR